MPAVARHRRRYQKVSDHGFKCHQNYLKRGSAAETSADRESAERRDRERPLRVFGDEIAQLLTGLGLAT